MLQKNHDIIEYNLCLKFITFISSNEEQNYSLIKDLLDFLIYILDSDFLFYFFYEENIL